MKWNIFHADREYAREIGDPVLGTVEIAENLPFNEAKHKAERLVFGDPDIHLPAMARLMGIYAWPAPDPQNAGPGDPDHDLAYDPEMADEKDEIEYAPEIPDTPVHVDLGEAE